MSKRKGQQRAQAASKRSNTQHSSIVPIFSIDRKHPDPLLQFLSPHGDDAIDKYSPRINTWGRAKKEPKYPWYVTAHMKSEYHRGISIPDHSVRIEEAEIKPLTPLEVNEIIYNDYFSPNKIKNFACHLAKHGCALIPDHCAFPALVKFFNDVGLDNQQQFDKELERIFSSKPWKAEFEPIFGDLDDANPRHSMRSQLILLELDNTGKRLVLNASPADKNKLARDYLIIQTLIGIVKYKYSELVLICPLKNWNLPETIENMQMASLLQSLPRVVMQVSINNACDTCAPCIQHARTCASLFSTCGNFCLLIS